MLGSTSFLGVGCRQIIRGFASAAPYLANHGHVLNQLLASGRACAAQRLWSITAALYTFIQYLGRRRASRS